MPDRCFTPRTARQTLDELRPAAEAMCRLYRMMERRQPRRIAPDQWVDPLYFSLASRLHSTLEQIRNRGVQVKDVRQGLLDFPARRAGRQVLLCWKVGEPSLAYWHDLETGFAGRRPVDDDGPWDDD
jgi:hypothetical protein